MPHRRAAGRDDIIPKASLTPSGFLLLTPVHPAKGHYRPDIDGIRALAITLVVVYHLGVPFSGLWPLLRPINFRIAAYVSRGIGGGFIGVDVFFVISGYLISSILLRDLDRGTFSVAAFYERRIRRIFPALIAVVLFTVVAGCFWLLPGELVTLSKSAMAGVGSIANLFFYSKAGYFDNSSKVAPLVHTWSLGVEEQFYIVCPLLLFLLHRHLRRHLRLGILVLLFVSLLLSEYTVRHHSAAAFFLVQNRAWELFIGTFLALELPFSLGTLARNLIAVLGVLMILVPAFVYTDETRFPGLTALPPCVGTALLIWSGRQGTLVSSLLSARPVVFLGLISYSLYLWHWPLLVFAKLDVRPFSDLPKGWLLLLILAIATVSWRWIEAPFRRGTGGKAPGRRTVFIRALGASLAVVALCVGILLNKGFPNRFNPREQALYAALDRPQDEWGAPGCFLDESHPTLAPECLQESPEKPNVLLLGSSVAADKWYGLSTVFPELHFLRAAGSDCHPLLGAEGEPAFCEHLRSSIFDKFLPAHRIDAVVLSVRWRTFDGPALEKTLARFHELHIPVCVLGSGPMYDQPLPRVLVTASRQRHPELILKHRVDPDIALEASLRSMTERSPEARYFSVLDTLCGPEGRVCKLTLQETIPLMEDDIHVTQPGSLYLAEQVRNQRALLLRNDLLLSGRRSPTLAVDGQ